jgi:1-hydroxy-2-methyl-2-(E)-butenyl 4-diphosphate synthase
MAGAGRSSGAGPRIPFDPFRPVRRRTRVVSVGSVRVGGDEPIRIQSMTNTNTLDTQATVEQTVRLAEAGCEVVRITAPSIRDAENLREIKRSLAARGVYVPLVADIHFTPNAAMIAAEIVEKVRINPGNYADKKRFEVREYDDREYADELERVAARFRPLVLRCKQNGVALRIGTNHGSLSDRIMNRFGDTPQGMVESALEFLDVCEGEGFRDVVFSMKSSNTQVAIAAYRLLAARLEERAPGEPSYPFHVGVTEAGDSEDGRIKSAIGIGALLEDGLGDTIRVSLTEDPVREIPVAREIARCAGRQARSAQAGADARPPIAVASAPFADPFAHARRGPRSSDCVMPRRRSRSAAMHRSASSSIDPRRSSGRRRPRPASPSSSRRCATSPASRCSSPGRGTGRARPSDGSTRSSPPSDSCCRSRCASISPGQSRSRRSPSWVEAFRSPSVASSVGSARGRRTRPCARSRMPGGPSARRSSGSWTSRWRRSRPSCGACSRRRRAKEPRR